MTTMDWTAIIVMGAAAAVTAISFALIANTLFEHGLADRNHPPANILTLYKRYRHHIRSTTGDAPIFLWIHMAAAGSFIGAGVLYMRVHLVFNWTF
jgi:fermentation-respiration switch protein FrsA (DUF1100 family)